MHLPSFRAQREQMETYIVAVLYHTESVRSSFTDNPVANLDLELRMGEGVI